MVPMVAAVDEDRGSQEISDERHWMKNRKCKLLRELKRVPVDNKLLLTGAPLQNNLAGLWSLLNFIFSDIFSFHQEFESWYDNHCSLSTLCNLCTCHFFGLHIPPQQYLIWFELPIYHEGSMKLNSRFAQVFVLLQVLFGKCLQGGDS